MPFPLLTLPNPALLLLVFSPTTVAQPQAITDRNINSAVGTWMTRPTTATTMYGGIGDWNVAAVTNIRVCSMPSRRSTLPSADGTLLGW